MTKRFKKILFFGLLIFFLITAPAIIFYSQGYRFDFENMKIVQTGGLFFKISPPGVTIDLDQKLLKKTNFFFDTAFISGLIPKDYQVTIQKTEHHPWSKGLEVKESQVTEAKHIILFPKNPKFNLTAKQIDGFFPAPNGKEIIFKIDTDEGWVLNSFNIQTQEQKEVISEQELKTLEPDKKISDISFLNLLWSDDSRKILVEIKSRGQKQYLIAETGPEINFFILDVEANMKKLAFNPNNSEELFFIAPEPEEEPTEKTEELQIKKLVIFRLKSDGERTMLKISAPSFEQNIISYLVLDDNILWLTDTGFLYQGRLVNTDKIELLEILNLKPISIHEQANYQIIAENLSSILLKQDEALYYLNPETHLLEQIFDKVRTVEFSQDMKKITVSTGNQIWLFYLDREYEQPQREIKDKILLAGFPEQISNLFWLNNFYLIFQIEDSIKIAETDNRSRVNLIELTTFPSPSIHWSQNQKTLLVLTENNLFSCNNILR